MRYNIFGGNLPAVDFELDQGESIYTQSGGMTWMSEHIKMETNTRGGLFKGIARAFSGDSIFMATYTAQAHGQHITFASSAPGEILTLDVAPGRTYIAQKGAFLCATPNVDVKAVFTKSFTGGLFGGEGFILQEFSGNGTVFVELDGCAKAIDLAPGEKLLVDTGNIAAFESTVRYSVETVKGFKNILFGGEGLFLTVLTGPGRVWVQTINMGEFAKKIIPYIPKTSS